MEGISGREGQIKKRKAWRKHTQFSPGPLKYQLTTVGSSSTLQSLGLWRFAENGTCSTDAKRDILGFAATMNRTIWGWHQTGGGGAWADGKKILQAWDRWCPFQQSSFHMYLLWLPMEHGAWISFLGRGLMVHLFIEMWPSFASRICWVMFGLFCWQINVWERKVDS